MGLHSEDVSLEKVVLDRFELSMTVPQEFFNRQADAIADACWKMAHRFHQGGRLVAFGNGAWATDAQHVAVEFVHPVIVGKRALPALALTNDSAALSAPLSAPYLEPYPGPAFFRQLAILGRPEDIAMGFSMDGNEANILETLNQARRKGMLTLGFTGIDGGEMARSGLDFCFVVPTEDAMAAQETHETLYHVLWELVHIFFEHEGLLE